MHVFVLYSNTICFYTLLTQATLFLFSLICFSLIIYLCSFTVQNQVLIGIWFLRRNPLSNADPWASRTRASCCRSISVSCQLSREGAPLPSGSQITLQALLTWGVNWYLRVWFFFSQSRALFLSLKALSDSWREECIKEFTRTWTLLFLRVCDEKYMSCHFFFLKTISLFILCVFVCAIYQLFTGYL